MQTYLTMKPLLLDVQSLLKNSIHVKEINSYKLNDQFHFHNACEIALIIKGKGKRLIGDNMEDFTDGDLVLIGPQLPHITYTDTSSLVENDLNVQAIVVYFKPDWLNESHLDSVDLIRFRELFKDLNRGIKIRIGQTKKRIIKQLLKIKKIDGLQRIILILKILDIISNSKEYVCLASEGYVNSFSQKHIKRLDEVFNYIMGHFYEDITLQKIALIANMTPTAFCKFFKNKTNKTLSNFINEIRISYACKLLLDQNLSISQICYQSGFNNLPNFNKNFKRFTNQVPSAYKENFGIAN
jgi:AraC-like DNA-binding protein